jgi:hypothetical protein
VPPDDAPAESETDAPAESDAEAPAPARRAEQEALEARLAALGDAVIESTPVFDDIVVRVQA